MMCLYMSISDHPCPSRGSRPPLPPEYSGRGIASGGGEFTSFLSEGGDHPYLPSTWEGEKSIEKTL